MKEKEIKQILKEFWVRTHVTHSLLFSDEGLLIAVEPQESLEEEDYYPSIGAICATLTSIAHDGVNMIFTRRLKQLIIQAGHLIEKEAFTIVIEVIKEGITLAVLFPSSLNLSVILFEMKLVIRTLSTYFNECFHFHEEKKGENIFH